MAGSGTGYGQYSAQALEPYRIEDTLAQAGYGQYPAEAQTQLDYYQMERLRHENLYGQEMEKQHAFAKQNLEQQLYEANLKGLYEAGKTPGMLQLVAASPQYQGVLGGADPDTVASVVQQQREQQLAADYEKGASGLKHAIDAGAVIPDTASVPGMRVMGTTQIGDPVAIRAALIAANARVAAARAGAVQQAQVPTTDPIIGYDSLRQPIRAHGVPLMPGQTIEESVKPYLQNQDFMRNQAATGGGSPTPTTSSTVPFNPKKVTMQTNVPNAQNTSAQPAAGASRGRQLQQIPPGSAQGNQLQTEAMMFIRKLEAAQPQLAGLLRSRTGVIDIRNDNGRPVILAQDGTLHAFR